MEKLLNAKDTAAILGVQLSTIYAWRHRGALPYMKVGARLRFSPTKLTAWLKQRERSSEGHPNEER